jgi:hypothetical protein
LLVALIPGLLMMATFGLERVEASLRRDTFSADDVTEFLHQAEASDVSTLARDGMHSALHGMQRRLSERETAPLSVTRPLPAEGLPTRQYFPPLANPEFQQTEYANPV